MAKVNNTRKSDSWRPGMVANGSGMVSKNQKRKEKRYSHNLSSLKSQDTPTKKSLLGPLSKFKENLNQSLNIPSFGKKENKLLSTSLPIKADKKSIPSPKKNAKPMGILSNSNTPKTKGNKVTFNMDKNVDKFIDSEAEEGEEPVDTKVVKPYAKGSQMKQQLKRRMSMMDVGESEDDDSESDDESNDSSSQFVDMEASEGEETDSVDEEESYDENSDDDLFNDVSDEEDGSAEELESEDDDLEGDSDEESADESEEESADESEEEMATTNSSKVVATPNRRESMVALPIKKEKAESTPLAKKAVVKSEPVTPQPKKIDVKLESTPQSKKVNVKAEFEQKKKNIKVEPELKKEKIEPVTPAKAQSAVDKTIQSPEKVEEGEKKKVKETVVGETSSFVGFIRRIFKTISIEDVKSALQKKIDAKKIVGLRLTRDRNVFVYLKDENTLDSLLNHSFPVNENFKFVVYKARDSTAEKKPKFVAFLPKVPLTMTVAELKDAIVKYVGTDCVESVQLRKVFKQQQSRNVLVSFADVESLKKIVQKGDLKVGSVQIIFRAAYETTVDVPTYRVLITSIPEKTTEAALKKAIESRVGQNTVQSIQFSQKKSSFAFVSMKNEEAQKKTLELGKNLSVNGTKVEVAEFKPRIPIKKRAAPSDEAKEKKKNKAKKQKLADGTASNAPNPSKKNKTATAALQKGASQDGVQKAHPTPSKGAVAQTNAKQEAQNASGQEVTAKSKKKKQFRKPGKGANTPESQSPAKGPAAGKNANQKPQPQTPAKGATLGKGANPKQESRSPANGLAPGKGAKPKHQQKSPKGAPHAKPQSSPANASVNGAGARSPKQKKNKNKQQQQHSPKPVAAKKQALVEKIASKKKNKKNSMKRDAS